MVRKAWFRGGGSGAADEMSVEDLIILERYDEAELQLKGKLKANSADLHSHMKLAEVYGAQKLYTKAVEEFIYVAEEYAQDGFYDKGIALLAKASRLAPLDPSLQRKIESLQRAKSLEQSRIVAVEGLRQGRGAGDAETSTSALELQRLWHQVAKSSLVARISDEQLRRMFAVMRLTRFDADSLLVERGSDRAEMYLVVQGMVEAVVEQPDGRLAVLRTFGSGDMIGEGALLEHRPWPATYRVSDAASLLVLDRAGFEQVLVGNPDPRALVDALREQHNDRDVLLIVSRLGAAS